MGMFLLQVKDIFSGVFHFFRLCPMLSRDSARSFAVKREVFT